MFTIRVDNLHSHHFGKIHPASQWYQPTGPEESTSSHSTYKCVPNGGKPFTFRSFNDSLYPEEGMSEANLIIGLNNRRKRIGDKVLQKMPLPTECWNFP